MLILWGARTRSTNGPIVNITCPLCHVVGPAVSLDREEQIHVFYLPVVTVRNTYVRCRNCDRTLHSQVGLAMLPLLNADEMAAAIDFRISKLGRVLTILSLVTWVLPIIGAAVGILARVLARRAPRRWRIVANLGLALSLAVTIAFVLVWFLIG